MSSKKVKHYPSEDGMVIGTPLLTNAKAEYLDYIQYVAWDVYLEGGLKSLPKFLSSCCYIPVGEYDFHYLECLSHIKENTDILKMPIDDFEKIFTFRLEYDGCYPNLCTGDLIIHFDNVRVDFPKYCLSSNGSVSFTDDWGALVCGGSWNVKEWPDKLPEGLRGYVLDKINEQIERGCCGGCV